MMSPATSRGGAVVAAATHTQRMVRASVARGITDKPVGEQGMKLEVVADAAHGQPEPAAGRIVDDNHWLIIKSRAALAASAPAARTPLAPQRRHRSEAAGRQRRGIPAWP